MSAQERFDSLPDHFVHMTVEGIVANWLVGQWAVANHPQTVLNPHACGFVVKEVKIEPCYNDEQEKRFPHGRIYVRGENTCWFSPELYKIDICRF